MEKSKNYNFNLPNSANDEIADINDISDNFRIIDNIMNETDQTFEPTSTKAASGKAVAEAFNTNKDIIFLKQNKANLVKGWINANVDSAGNYTYNTPTRIITTNYIMKESRKVNIEINTGYEYVRRYFDNEGIYITGDATWQTSNVTFTQEYLQMKIVIRKSDNTNITPEEASNISIYHDLCIDLNDLSSKVWLTLGDSITARGWYQDLVSQLSNIQYVNYGIGGTCIAKPWDSTTNAFCVRYTEMQDDCDLVTVWGGVNDFSSNIPLGTKGSTNMRQFYGALKVLIEGLITKYPGKKIGFILTTPVNTTDTSLNCCFEETNTAGHKLIDYCNAIIDMCNDYSIPVLDLYHNSGFNQLNMGIMTSNSAQTSPDGLHPSMLGMNFVKYQILDFIKTKLLI